jgi:hypothetical protein
MTLLLAWHNEPDYLVDEDVLPPTRQIIYKAYRLAMALRDNRSPGPLRVVPDGDGGIVFERQEGAVFETISVESTGRVEVMSFEGSRLTARITLPETAEGAPTNDNSEIWNPSLLSRSVCSDPAE